MDQKARPIVVGLGEVLWDMLPSGKQLGGAPANFAYHAQALGAHGIIASCVGDDDLGAEILARLDALGVDRRHIQARSGTPTGTVSVALRDGHPDYTIHENVAWDFIESTGDLQQLAARADAVCVGSLAQRSPVSHRTIRSILAVVPGQSLRIFDINLRQHYYSRDVVVQTLEQCNILKLNDEEWPIVAKLTGITETLPGGAEALRKRYELRLIAMTQGSRGSTLFTAEGVHRQPARKVEIADTVGAGDSFTAALVVGLLRGHALERVHRHASEVAAFVCTQHGATPRLPTELTEG